MSNTNLKLQINRTLSLITDPIIKNFSFFIICILLFEIPIIWQHILRYLDGEGIRVIFLIAAKQTVCITWSYILCLLRTLCKNVDKRLFEKTHYITSAFTTTTYVVLSLLVFADCFLLFYFKSRISPIFIRLLTQANESEASGFFSLYIFNAKFAYLLSAVAFMAIVLVAIHRHLRLKANSTPIKYMILLCLIASVPYSCMRDLEFCKQLIKSIYLKKHIKECTVRVTSPGLLTYSLWLQHMVMQDIDILHKTLKTETLPACNPRSNKVVLILGESFNKHHSSLYNYKLNTNPLLAQRVTSQNLYVFSDVITPANYTDAAMKALLSFTNHDNNEYWANTPLFMRLFKLAGYKNTIISNQETKAKGDEIAYYSCGTFLVDAAVSDLLFDNFNEDTYKYDLDLVNSSKELIDNKEASFIFYHLMGQHMSYGEKCPEEIKVFRVEDIDRPELNNRQKKDVADYANATLYNDLVVNSIIEQFKDDDAIVIYLADHGEEVHDYRDFVCRDYCNANKSICRNQFEIPFMIWMSDKYKENHPDIVKGVESSVDKPFMTDDLPHLMLDIAGIESKWFEPNRSLINGQYNSARKRYISTSNLSYEEIMSQED